MSIHRSLATSGRARRHRNVLTREERIAKLEDEERWDETKAVWGLPKVRSIKPVAGGKKKKKEEKAAEGDEAAVATDAALGSSDGSAT